jgi:hypothetical protein
LQQGENTPSAFFPVSDIELEAALKACCAIPALTLSLCWVFSTTTSAISAKKSDAVLLLRLHSNLNFPFLMMRSWIMMMHEFLCSGSIFFATLSG